MQSSLLDSESMQRRRDYMTKKMNPIPTSPPDHQATNELIRVINQISAALQQYAHTEGDLSRAIQDAFEKHEFWGGLCMLDETGENLVFPNVAIPNPVRKALNEVEKVTRPDVMGFQFSVDQVDIYRHVVENKEALVVTNTNEFLAQSLPSLSSERMEKLVESIDGITAFFGPLIIKGKVTGILSLAGKDLGDEMLPALEVLTNHVAIALENTRLNMRVNENEEKYRSLFEGVPVGLYRTSLDGKILSANAALVKMLGYPDIEALLGINVIDMYVMREDREREMNHLQQYGIVDDMEMQLYRYDGKRIWVRDICRYVRVPKSGEQIMEGSLVEITARKQTEERLIYEAMHDSLTGLPNRALFSDRLDRALARQSRQPEYSFAVLFMDLDRFKVVNDSLGHVAGDQLLKKASRRLEGCIRALDTVARLGGDEFVILLEDIQDIQDAIMIADRIRESLTAPFMIDRQEVYSTASIGIAISDESYEVAEHMLRDADIAMYYAKSRGKDRYEIFVQEMRQHALTRMALEHDLRLAMDNDELRVYYQPIVELETGQIRGFEALLRWEHPRWGLMGPDDFLHISEETGLIHRIGQWVFYEACMQLNTWQDEFPSDPPLTMSVNVSGKEFTHPDLIEQVASTLYKVTIPPGTLQVEITEGAIMEDTEFSISRVEQLKALGIEVQIDDFGIGYSSLYKLSTLPVGTLKIDRSFLRQLNGEDEMEKIIRTIVSLAHDLGMEAIAEGIEKESQLDSLSGFKCDFGQGFLFSKAVDHQMAATLLAKQM